VESPTFRGLILPTFLGLENEKSKKKAERGGKLSETLRYISGFPSLVMIPPLISTHLSLLPELCYSPDQVAHYHIISLLSQGLFLEHCAQLRVKLRFIFLRNTYWAPSVRLYTSKQRKNRFTYIRWNFLSENFTWNYNLISVSSRQVNFNHCLSFSAHVERIPLNIYRTEQCFGQKSETYIL
jgi:hypothetical protein